MRHCTLRGTNAFVPQCIIYPSIIISNIYCIFFFYFIGLSYALEDFTLIPIGKSIGCSSNIKLDIQPNKVCENQDSFAGCFSFFSRCKFTNFRAVTFILAVLCATYSVSIGNNISLLCTSSVFALSLWLMAALNRAMFIWSNL